MEKRYKLNEGNSKKGKRSIEVVKFKDYDIPCTLKEQNHINNMMQEHLLKFGNLHGFFIRLRYVDPPDFGDQDSELQS